VNFGDNVKADCELNDQVCERCEACDAGNEAKERWFYLFKHLEDWASIEMTNLDEQDMIGTWSWP
jgi:hypothetical protein